MKTTKKTPAPKPDSHPPDPAARIAALQRQNEKLRAALRARGACQRRLRRQRRGLQELTRKRADELKKIYARLAQAQKMEAIGTLAGGIAHDFNNILMGIQGNAYLVKAGIGEDHPHHDKLSNIERYVERGANLTQELLGFARGGKSNVRRTDVNELLEKTVKMFGRTAKEIRVRTRLANDLRPVHVDRAQIEQVLLNLFINARQAMGDGGTLTVGSKNLILDQKAAVRTGLPAGGYVAVTVTDTGPGIDSAVSRRIFEPFFTTREVGKGAGLGLSTAYGILRDHGGAISVENAAGGGASFSLTIPAAADRGMAPKGAPSFREGACGATILLVDDEEMIRQSVGQMLEKLGYEVLTAADGQEALKRVAQYPKRVDLVILDLIMPGMSGAETLRRLRAADEELRILLASGYSLDARISPEVRAGCRGFMQKPFRFEELAATIADVLSFSC